MPVGSYIVIEGSDGTGKTTQIALLRQQLQKRGVESITIHEPGGTSTAEALRTIIKDVQLPRDPWTNVLLFTAARRLAWLQTIQPALKKGTWVLASRNWISTVAYQGYGEGVPIDAIIARTNQDVDSHYLRPDVTLVLDLPSEALRRSRLAKRDASSDIDTFESKNSQFQKRMLKGYKKIAKQYHFPLINAADTPKRVEAAIWLYIAPLIKTV